MLKYIKKVLSLLIFLCFVTEILEASSAGSVLDNPPAPSEFPNCPELVTSSNIGTVSATIRNFFQTRDPSGAFERAVFPRGVPTNKSTYNAMGNPKNVYTTWYNSKHAVSAASAAQIEEERKKREEAEQRVIQQQQAKMLAEQRSDVLQQQLITTKKEKETLEQKASAAEQQLTVVGQKAEIAQLDALVSKNIPQAVASEVLTLLNLPEHKAHQFLFDDTTYTVHLNVELKDGTVTEKRFNFPAGEYFVVVEGFKALAQQYQLMQTVFGDSQRSAYQLHFKTPNPDLKGAPGSLVALMDSYYHAIDEANQGAKLFGEMEIAMTEANSWVNALAKLPTKAAQRTFLVDDMLQQTHPFCKSAKSLGVDLRALEEVISRNMAANFDIEQAVRDSLEIANQNFADAQKFSVDIYSLYCDVSEKFIAYLDELKTKFGFILKPVFVDRCIVAIKGYIEEAKEKRREAALKFYDECAADPEVQAAQIQMREEGDRVLNTFVADVFPHLVTDMTETPMNTALNAALTNINASLPSNQKVKKSEHRAFAYSSVVPLFLSSNPFLFIYAINLPKLGLLFSPKSISSIKEKIQIFDEELKYLTKNEKKALFIYVQGIVNNFDALTQEYTEVTLEKKYLKPQSISDEKDVLEALLNRIKMSLNNTASKRTAIYSLVPAAAIYEIANSLRAHGIDEIKRNIRRALLAELLDEHNPLKDFLLGSKITSVSDLDGYLDEPDYHNRSNENILKQCWQYLHSVNNTSSAVMHNIYPSDPNAVDTEIKILQEGKKIVEANIRIIDGSQYNYAKSASVITGISTHIKEIETIIQSFMSSAGIVNLLLLPEPFKTYYEFMDSTKHELAAKTRVDGGQQYLWQCDARKFVDILSQSVTPIKDILHNPQKLIPKLMNEIATVREALRRPNKLPQGSYNPLQAGGYNKTINDAERVLASLGAAALSLMDLPTIFEQKEAIEKLLKKFGLS